MDLCGPPRRPTVSRKSVRPTDPLLPEKGTVRTADFLSEGDEFGGYTRIGSRRPIRRGKLSGSESVHHRGSVSGSRSVDVSSSANHIGP